MWYDTGTVQITQGSTVVTGTGTQFVSEVRVGDAFRGPDGKWYQVLNTPSQTTLAIKPAYEGPTVSGAYFSVTPVPGFNQALAQRVSVIIDKAQVQSDAAAASALSAANSATSAATSKAGATQSEVNAATHAANALASKNAAAQSETNAGTHAANALASKNAASQSETNAGTHAANALASRNAAAQSATDAANTLASKANKGANSDITSLTGLTTALSQAQGGTGNSQGRPLFNEVGVNSASNRYNVQGLFLGWNELGNGVANFICNKGGGVGGFTWRTVLQENQGTGPTMSLSYDGRLDVPSMTLGAPLPVTSGGTGANSLTSLKNSMTLGTGQSATFAAMELSSAAPYIDFHFGSGTTDYDVRLINSAAGVLSLFGSFDIGGTLSCRGYKSRAGLTGAYREAYYNYDWTGSNMDVWVGTTYVGSMTLFQSDYRFKKLVKTVVAPFLERCKSYRVVTYERKRWGEVFAAGDGTVYQGLIAHEAQAVNPLAATGEKDGKDENGNDRIQQLDPMALITDLMGGVTELDANDQALNAQITALKDLVAELASNSQAMRAELDALKSNATST